MSGQKVNADNEASSLWNLDMSVLRQQEAITLEARIKTDAKFRECKRKDWRLWIDSRLHQQIDQANQRSKLELSNRLRPKKMIFRHAGKIVKPLPGLRDEEGKWKFSRACIRKQRPALDQ